MGSSYCPHDITQYTLTNQSINLLISLQNVDQDMLDGTICILTIPWYIKIWKTWRRQPTLLLTVLLYCRWTLPLLLGTKNLSSRRRPRVMRRWHQQKWWVLPSLSSFTSSSLIFFSLRLSHNFNMLILFFILCEIYAINLMFSGSHGYRFLIQGKSYFPWISLPKKFKDNDKFEMKYVSVIAGIQWCRQ